MELTTKAEPIFGKFKGLGRLLWQLILDLKLGAVNQPFVYYIKKIPGKRQFPFPAPFSMNTYYVIVKINILNIYAQSFTNAKTQAVKHCVES